MEATWIFCESDRSPLYDQVSKVGMSLCPQLLRNQAVTSPHGHHNMKFFMLSYRFLQAFVGKEVFCLLKSRQQSVVLTLGTGGDMRLSGREAPGMGQEDEGGD